MNQSEKLRQFILDHLDSFEYSGGGGFHADIPEYDLYAQDYLYFAEQELVALQNTKTPRDEAGRVIRFVSHLKQAMDCQLNIFLEVYNIEGFFSSKRLGIDKKLEFLEKLGVFSSGSLKRFNSLRNRMEHDFKVPAIGDAEVYFDLVLALVSVLQFLIDAVCISEIEIQIFDPDSTHRRLDRNEIGNFYVRYLVGKPAVEVGWRFNSQKESLECDLRDFQEFTFFMKVLFLLQRLDSFASRDYIKSQISI